MKHFVPALAWALFLLACRDGPTGLGYEGSIEYDWNVSKGFKYRYAGTAIEERGARYLFYCGNIDRSDRSVVTDHIVMRKAVRRAGSGEWEYGDEGVALSPR